MITKNLVLASCAAVVLGVAGANAGPCNTGGKSAQDAGSGTTPGHTEQTIGSSGSANAEHPPTSTMNRATGDVAASSEDAQRQMQGQSNKVKALNLQRNGRSRLLTHTPNFSIT